MSAEDPWRSTAYNIFPSFIMDSFPGHCNSFNWLPIGGLRVLPNELEADGDTLRRDQKT